ncbi:MAG: GGDEF domain-containing protein [Rhodoferax sp.]|jgi:GGDEF domain-containing protein|nr:GGDEF domain-containing protein [Rhodoferax sp.]
MPKPNAPTLFHPLTAAGKPVTARNLIRHNSCVTAAVSCRDVIKRFHDDQQLNSLAVVDDENRVAGVLRSLEILRRGTENYFDEIFGQRSCTTIMDSATLVFDAELSLLQMSNRIASLNDRQLVDGFFVSEAGRYIGTGHMTDLIKAIADQQISLARYANPLTLLPGNVPIDEEILNCLSAKVRFVVGYFDLDNFKAFNDVYGYRAGDAVIQLAAKVLGESVDPTLDFLGHVGGDDYVVVFKSTDWESRVQQVLARFDEEVRHHFTQEHQAKGGIVTNNRQGQAVFHPLTCLSAGLIRVEVGEFDSHAEISQRLVEAKKMAKLTPGSSYFIDRRQR